MAAVCMPGPWWTLKRFVYTIKYLLQYPVPSQKVLEKAKDMYAQIEQVTLELKVCVNSVCGR